MPFQLVHHDDVAAAMRAGVLGRGKPGIYNLAGPGQLTVKQLAEALGWYSIPVPELAVDAVAEVIGRLGFLPAQAQWIAAFREPVIMSTAKARRELRWRPKHDAMDTLRQTITAARTGPTDPLGKFHLLTRRGAPRERLVRRVGFARVSDARTDPKTEPPRRAAVVTDSTPYLPAALIARSSITQVSLYVGWEAQLRPEHEYTDLDAFYARLSASPQLPSTSQPSIGDFLAAYKPLLEAGHDVVSLHIASGLSGTCESAREAARLLAEEGQPGTIHVIDSQTGAGGLGCLVVLAAQLADQNVAAAAIVEAVARTRATLDIWFCLDTLEYLRRGGRIGAAQAALGTALKVKPILTFGTEIAPVGRVRTHRRAFERMVAYLRELHERGASDWIIQHAQSPARRRAAGSGGPGDLRFRAPVLHGGRPGARRPSRGGHARRRHDEIARGEGLDQPENVDAEGLVELIAATRVSSPEALEVRAQRRFMLAKCSLARRIDAQRARTQCLEVTMTDREDRLAVVDPREASLERPRNRLLSRGAYIGLIVDLAQQLKGRSCGERLLHVEHPTGAQHARALLERRIHRVHRNVVEAVEEDHDVEARVGKWELLGRARDIALGRRGGVLPPSVL